MIRGRGRVGERSGDENLVAIDTRQSQRAQSARDVEVKSRRNKARQVHFGPSGFHWRGKQTRARRQRQKSQRTLIDRRYMMH